MKVFRFWLLSLLFTVFVGCDDDKLSGPSGGDNENDNFIGDARVFRLGDEASGLTSTDVTCKLLAPDGQIISRHGSHSRLDGVSDFVLENGLKDGVYRLLYAEYPIQDNGDLAGLPEKFKTAQYGLGCRIAVTGNEIVVRDDFDDDIDLFGSGTKDDPYIISSYSHLITLMKYVNSDETNKKITPETYFKQTNPIDMEQASFECDVRYGWYPIGADTNTPFRGVYLGDEISYLWIDRPNTAGVGLFGFVYDATLDGVKMTHADISGNFAVGAAVGATITGGDKHGQSSFTNCSVSNSTVAGSSQSFAIGGLVGAADMYTSTLFQKCSSDGNNISGSYNVGGIVGGSGMYSNLTLGECSNSSPVTSEYSGAGGIVGAADTLYVSGSKNTALITGASKYSPGESGNAGIGAGGIVGGSGVSWLTACTNTGEVKGKYGVGGLLGSTRIKGSDDDSYVYNNTYIRWSQNLGKVSGTQCVGGICGEAQFGCYGVYNNGDVSGGDYTAGIIGITSIAVAHNAVNTGTVSGGSYSAGIVGKTTWGSVALDHNYGKVTGSGSHTAGIIGLAGNNTIVHYCGNMGAICGSGKGPAAGIVAEIGDPREWTGMNIAECVVGSAEIVMAFLGPCIAVAAGYVESVSEVASVILEVVETSADAALLRADTILASFGLAEILSPEEAEELEASLSGVSEGICDEVKNNMSAVRYSFTGFDIKSFDKAPITADYNNYVESTLNYYEAEGNDEIFNESINKQREDRMEELEHISHIKEIVHEVIAGVSIAVSTVAIVGSAVASGGAAVPFLIAGSAAAVVGGVNAITKSTTDFAENAVVISQCVNSGTVTGASDKFAGIVGILQDNCIVSDCLNTAEISNPLVCEAKSKSEISYCMSVCVAGYDNHSNSSHFNSVVYYYPNNLSENNRAGTYCYYDLMYLEADEINDKASYDKSGVYRVSEDSYEHWSFKWDLGSDKKWNVTNSVNGFPVPCYSEMRK